MALSDKPSKTFICELSPSRVLKLIFLKALQCFFVLKMAFMMKREVLLSTSIEFPAAFIPLDDVPPFPDDIFTSVPYILEFFPQSTSALK